MERNVFHINPPTETQTEYVLLVSRGGTPFGGSPPIVFAVDGLSLLTGPDQKPIAMQGFLKQEDGTGKVVIQFPVDTQYLMVERSAVSMLTEIEAAKLQEADRAEFRAALPDYGKQHRHSVEDMIGGEPEQPEALPVEVSHPGQYV